MRQYPVDCLLKDGSNVIRHVITRMDHANLISPVPRQHQYGTATQLAGWKQVGQFIAYQDALAQIDAHFACGLLE